MLYITFIESGPLDELLISNGNNTDRGVVLGGDHVSGTRSSGLTLQADLHSISTSLSTSLVVSTGTLQKVITALAVVDVLNTNIDTLLHVTITDLLVNNHTDGMRGHIENNTGLSMVELVRHTTVNSTVGLDVNNITDLVGLHVSRQLYHTMLTEVAREEMTGTSTETEGVWHFWLVLKRGLCGFEGHEPV